MNFVLLGLFTLVLLYLQINFLSLFNLILIGLLVGTAAALETNSVLTIIFLGIMAVVILVSFIFKTIAVIQAVNEFMHTMSVNDTLQVSSQMYVSRNPLIFLPKGFVKLDVDESCKDCEDTKESFYAPTEFIDGSRAKNELEKCANVCMNNDKCSFVMMPNQNGKNNECVYYGTEADATGLIDDMKRELVKLNSSTDTMKATHYAVIHK